MPVGAFGGRLEIMEKLAPIGPVYQAGTLSGNPVAMAAGLACLKVSQPGVHSRLNELTEKISSWFKTCFRRARYPDGLSITSVACLVFSSPTPQP